MSAGPTLTELAAVAQKVAEAARLCREATTELARWGLEATEAMDAMEAMEAEDG